MTKEELNKHWELIEAFKNGEKIEYFNTLSGWIEINNPAWHLSVKYRIKPEPKFVPFTFEDTLCLLGRPVILKSTSSYKMVTGADDSGVILCGSHWNYSEFLDLFNFVDGTPCGKYVEE